MGFPFQAIARVQHVDDDGKADDFLLLATGGQLLAFDSKTQQLRDRWPKNEGSTSVSSSIPSDDTTGQPKKKQKLDRLAASPAIIKLVVSPNNEHAVVITEDKCVRVLRIEPGGRLVQLSQRTIPKRPCALKILSDNSTILCGDKFGDVYQLPLLVDDADAPNGTDAPTTPSTERPVFKPAASHLTVHSKRNRKALESQLRSKQGSGPTKEPLNFKHELLLGHVSMLTDLECVSRTVEKKRRNYIISTDRDEHIRISRAAPQAHVIEGYCFGHTEYISKISALPATDLLISGGGDSWLGLWHWPSQKLIRRIDLLPALVEALSSRPDSNVSESDGNGPEVNVSGIWPITTTCTDGKDIETFVVVSCERVPALFILPLTRIDQTSSAVSSCPLPSIPLDVVSNDTEVVVAFDVRTESKSRLISYVITNEEGKIRLAPNEIVTRQLEVASTFVDSSTSESDATIDQVLYNISTLRKRHTDYEEEETLNPANDADV